MAIRTGTKREVGDDTVDGRTHLSAFEIDTGKIAIGDRLRIAGAGLLCGGAAVVALLTRDDVGKALIAPVLTLGRIQCGAGGGDRRFRLLEGVAQADMIDREQYLAAPHDLIVTDMHLFDPAGYVGGQWNHIGPDLSISRLGGVSIVIIELPEDEHRDAQHEQGKERLEQAQDRIAVNGHGVCFRMR